MRLLQLLTLSTFWSLSLGAYAAAPDNYYSRLEGEKGTDLRKAAKAVVKNHTAISYGNSTWEAFLTTDVRIVDGRRCWWDMYSPNIVSASSAGDHSGMNIEHSIPNSWWGGTKNDAYKDLFELNPSDSNANSRKGNYPYGEIEGTPNFDNGVTRVGHPKSGMTGSSQGDWCFEPLDEYKGDFARSVFYMFTVYDDIGWKENTAWMYQVGSDMLLRPWAVEMLLRWCKLDPVSDKERKRNDAVYAVQHNRNPYIDLPGLEDYVYGPKRNIAFSLDHITNPVDPIDPVDPVDPVDPIDPIDPVDPVDPIDPVIPGGIWYAVTKSSELNDKDTYVIVTVSTDNFMADECAGTYMRKGLIANVQTSSAGASITTIPDGTALIKLENAGGNQYYMAVYDTHYNALQGYLTCSKTKSVSLGESKTDLAKATINITTAGEAEISFGNFGNLLYNASSPRFTTYTSNQEHLRLFRLKNDLSTGAEDIIEDTMAQVFTLQGAKVAEGEERAILDILPDGLYIVVKSGKSYKIIK